MSTASLLRQRVGGVIPPYLILILPAVAFMLMVYVYPFVLSVVTSFVDSAGDLSLVHYERAVELYFRDIVFTAVVTVFNTTSTIAAAIAFALYLRMCHTRISGLLGRVYKLGVFIPFVVVAQMMRSFLAPHGLLNVALAQVGIIDIAQPLQLFNFAGLSFGFMWKLVPFATLIIHAGFQMIDNSYIEAARSTGARTFAVLTRVMVPMNKSSILVATVLVYAQIVSTFTLPFMIMGGRKPTTLTVDIAHRVNYFSDFGLANALGVVSYILVLGAAVYYLKTTMTQHRSTGRA